MGEAEERAAEGGSVGDWLLGASELRIPQAVNIPIPSRPILRNTSLLFRYTPSTLVLRLDLTEGLHTS
jgi:hypothetical protein